MIPKSRFEELKGQLIRIYMKDLPEQHCIQLGKIEVVGEHIIIFKDVDHDTIMYVPMDSIVLIKKA